MVPLYYYFSADSEISSQIVHCQEGEYFGGVFRPSNSLISDHSWIHGIQLSQIIISAV